MTDRRHFAALYRSFAFPVGFYVNFGALCGTGDNGEGKSGDRNSCKAGEYI